MPRVALSTEEIAAFRRKVIHAATRLFAAQGYSAVTMRAIADELGTSAMAPYRYFENKAEIFALVRAEATRAFNACQLAVVQGDAPLLERLLRAREAYVRFALEQPDQYRIIFEQRHEPDDAYPELVEVNRVASDLMLRIGRLAVESGLLEGDPVTVAHLLWAQVHGLVSLHLAGKLQAGRSLEQLLTQSNARAVDIVAERKKVTPPAAAPKKRRKPAR